MSTAVLVVVGLIVPAVIIVLVTLVIMPGVWNWRVKIWEWNAGWLGLALAVAGAFMATEGLKDLYGRPRPDMLARCDPDLDNLRAYVVGGLGGKVEGAPTVVSWEICRNKGKELVVDGFVSFPSGHSSCEFTRYSSFLLSSLLFLFLLLGLLFGFEC